VFAVGLWGGVYFCTEWVEEKKTAKIFMGRGFEQSWCEKKLVPAFALV